MLKRWVSGLLAVVLLGVSGGFFTGANAATSMAVSDALIDVLKTMEGYSEKPYWDYAQWTVGYGTKCPDDKLEEYKANGITREEAQKLFETELGSFEGAVNEFSYKYGLNLNQNQFDALVSFSYNCGTAWMDETTGYFNTAVRQGDMGNALLYGMCLYSSAGGDYILTERRMCEANMYINGIYKASNGEGETFPENFKWVFLDGNGGKVRYVIYGYDANNPAPVSVSFSKIPTGVDGEGNPFVYELAGWYTEEGTKVEQLDGGLENGQVLYARWQTPDGEATQFPIGKPVDSLPITVTGDWVNVRNGPGTYYPKVGLVTCGTELTVTEVVVTSAYTWGKTEQGWLSLSYTNYDQVAAEREQFPKWGTVNGTAVNYRTEPVVSDATWAGQLNKGDRVEILEGYYDGSMRWGRLSTGYWICLDYVTYDEAVVPAITGVTLLRLPDQTEYVQMSKSMRLEGSILQVLHEDGSTSALSLTREMISGFSSENLGKVTVTVAYQGFYVNFQVDIIPPTITFLDWDGTVLSTGQYAYGEEVTPPPAPSREFDGTYYYFFAGWDKPVTVCAGTATYTATYRTAEDPEGTPVPDTITSDVFLISDGWIRRVPEGTTAGTLVDSILEKEYIAVYSGNSQVDHTLQVNTGMTVKLLDGTQEKNRVTVVVTGDVNGDGKITVTDMIGIKSHVLGKSELADAYAQAADCNADSGISITDFIQIKAHILGKSSIQPN